MAAKKVGNLIKTARTNAGLTQAALAVKIKGVSASDIGKAERSGQFSVGRRDGHAVEPWEKVIS